MFDVAAASYARHAQIVASQSCPQASISRTCAASVLYQTVLMFCSRCCQQERVNGVVGESSSATQSLVNMNIQLNRVPCHLLKKLPLIPDKNTTPLQPALQTLKQVLITRQGCQSKTLVTQQQCYMLLTFNNRRLYSMLQLHSTGQYHTMRLCQGTNHDKCTPSLHSSTTQHPALPWPETFKSLRAA